METMKPEHEIKGYSAGSSGYRRGCRCTECKASNTGYQRKHRSKSETEKPSREPSTSTVTVTKPQTYPVPEPVAPLRDETIPGQIIDALNHHEYISFYDGGEGWELSELATYLESMYSVECVIADEVLYVRSREVQPVYEPASDDRTVMPNSLEAPAVSMTARRAIPAIPAQPRIVTRASAPSVPATPIRAPHY